jgi:hypothetical protein
MVAYISRKMGYTHNTLPEYLSRLGADVHLATRIWRESTTSRMPSDTVCRAIMKTSTK